MLMGIPSTVPEKDAPRPGHGSRPDARAAGALRAGPGTGHEAPVQSRLTMPRLHDFEWSEPGGDADA
ncbi:hypothetical protein GCM10020221_29420 [Streptomyces thioluteus]|uniref:Uncharacterized protein n=1 Tax=Streptomyces thioluteus TaxID=66431 RepID=A0ABN3WZ29_STRTU